MTENYSQAIDEVWQIDPGAFINASKTKVAKELNIFRQYL